MLAHEIADMDGFHEVDEETEVLENQEQQEEAKIELPESFFAEFVDDVRQLAVFYITAYFEDQEMYCGGAIPAKMLSAERNVTRVLNLDISNAVNRAYEMLDECEWVSKDVDSESLVSEDIRLVRNTLDTIAWRGIPKALAGGILLMHLELVEGVGA